MNHLGDPSESRIMFLSSSILLSKLLSLASTRATETWLMKAIKAPANVEFVSPYTKTKSGLDATMLRNSHVPV
jgi:hypothetical protein